MTKKKSKTTSTDLLWMDKIVELHRNGLLYSLPETELKKLLK